MMTMIGRQVQASQGSSFMFTIIIMMIIMIVVMVIVFIVIIMIKIMISDQLMMTMTMIGRQAQASQGSSSVRCSDAVTVTADVTVPIFAVTVIIKVIIVNVM